jgi:hypothetical protein
VQSSNEEESKKPLSSAAGGRANNATFRPRSKLTENRFFKMVSLIYLSDLDAKEVTEFVFRM